MLCALIGTQQIEKGAVLSFWTAPILSVIERRYTRSPMSALTGRPRQSVYGFNSHSPYLSTIFVFMLSIGRHTTEIVT